MIIFYMVESRLYCIHKGYADLAERPSSITVVFIDTKDDTIKYT